MKQHQEIVKKQLHKMNDASRQSCMFYLHDIYKEIADKMTVPEFKAAVSQLCDDEIIDLNAASCGLNAQLAHIAIDAPCIFSGEMRPFFVSVSLRGRCFDCGAWEVSTNDFGLCRKCEGGL